MLSSQVVVFIVSGFLVSVAIGENFYYDSFGANILFDDEGGAAQTASGKNFLEGVTADTCAVACQTIKKCDCCNSFAYNPTTETCFLKHRNNETDLNRSTGQNINGYQSYKFWGFGFAYSGGLPDVAFGTTNQFGTAGRFAVAFVSKGAGQNAVNEGLPLSTASGEQFLDHTTLAKCGDECLKIQECDGFAFNPNQDGGKCFLKTGIPENSKFDSEFSSKGWTFYWQEGKPGMVSSPQDAAKNLEKCFCPCGSEFRCVACTTASTCTENI